MGTGIRRSAIACALLALGALAAVPTAIAAEPASAESGDAAATSSYDVQPREGELLAAGTYATETVSPLRISFTVPDGWFKGNVPFAVWESTSNSNVGFHAPENLPSDPCDPGAGMLDPAIGPTAAEFAAALRTVEGLTVSEPVDVTLSDYPGKQVDITADPDACPELGLWDFAGIRVPGPDSGASDRLWILDVEGTRLMIAAERSPGSPPEDLDEQRAILDSIQIEP